MSHEDTIYSYPKNSIKVLLLEKISPAAIDIFAREGYQVECRDKISEEELLETIPHIHILGVRSKTQVTDRVISASKKLLAIGCFCIGTDQTDLTSAAKHGKAVFNAPFANTRSVAEMVIGSIIMLLRQIPDRSNECHRGKWMKVSSGCYEARGKCLGIVGYGHVGSQVSILAESLGMSVKYYDVLPKLGLGNANEVESLDELLRVSDIITLHVPGTPETTNLLTSKELAKMKKGSYLINAARGCVLDLEDAAAAMRSGHLAGLALDVYPDEPASASDPFVSPVCGIPNVILTPHIGGSTEEAQASIGKEVATKIVSFVNTGATTGAVNVPEMHLPLKGNVHRILNFHFNVPGVLRDMNQILSAYNVRGQMLMTQGPIGYLIVDIDAEVSEEVQVQMRKLHASIKTRLLY